MPAKLKLQTVFEQILKSSGIRNLKFWGLEILWNQSKSWNSDLSVLEL